MHLSCHACLIHLACTCHAVVMSCTCHAFIMLCACHALVMLYPYHALVMQCVMHMLCMYHALVMHVLYACKYIPPAQISLTWNQQVASAGTWLGPVSDVLLLRSCVNDLVVSQAHNRMLLIHLMLVRYSNMFSGWICICSTCMK